MADNLTPGRRSDLMRRVRTRDTAPEVELRKALWARGVRGWRLHPTGIPGKPDVVWIGRRIAVFVDGAFWHGHPDYYHGQSGEFWDRKIARNKERDLNVNAELTDLGWTVFRVWDFEIERDAGACADRVARLLDAAR
ncbi:MAG: very short patch repair endonuclease [Solirubrobacterales bacterium]|nr:very short patch repair endonuclease [Solirubrobacterales bacterium]